MAQWIEQFRPKEEVVRSTRTRVTKNKEALLGLFIFDILGVRRTPFAREANWRACEPNSHPGHHKQSCGLFMERQTCELSDRPLGRGKPMT